MKENDIWWQGVVWDQFPDRLRVYLPGAAAQYSVSQPAALQVQRWFLGQVRYAKWGHGAASAACDGSDASSRTRF